MSVTLTLGHHDFLCAVEGFARGSHLRQHVWEDIVFRNIDQMDDDFMDFLWFYLRRDVWDIYFGEYGNKCGADNFLHCMAALHRGNRYLVVSKVKGERKKVYSQCYRYDGLYRPLKYVVGRKSKELKYGRFNAYIPDEDIIKVEVDYYDEFPDNRYVEQGKEGWWNDLDVYENGLNN